MFRLHVHLVFVTKYRRGVFTKAILEDVPPVMASVCRDFEALIVELYLEDYNVHLMVYYPFEVAVSFWSTACLQPPDSPKERSGDSSEAMGRTSLVPQLL